MHTYYDPYITKRILRSDVADFSYAMLMVLRHTTHTYSTSSEITQQQALQQG